MTAFSQWMADIQQRTESALDRALPAADIAPARLHEAMRYAVLGGGKRVRPLLVHAGGQLSGAEPERLDRVSCALEMIHAYSLVHDDMPCMDDDVLRRGKPTVHVQFDEKAGDAAPSPDDTTATAEAQPADGKGEGGAGAKAGKSTGPTLSELWAASGRVQYDVIRGERNFIIGRTTHAWTHDDERYSMETVIETAGLVGLVKPFKMIQRSEGRLGPRGLQPDKFTVERDGQLKERADFDWSSAKVVLIAGERRREFSIAEGDQDVLSLMHHLALQPEGPLRAELLVVTGKSAVRSVIENLGLEELEVPAGKVSAYHLGSTGHRGELKIDIWLARDYANLPVRLKITDKNGDVLDQVATGVDLGARKAE